ncbi:hypothetical protein cyc_05341 [Cyclospora cayetanensis]|uniref:Uncharacterized protein n=1 Tax=Cyclospora cayetanensis TaxID=88456 RepID=A0A1D3CZX0_9EIME|nr:hypothetical protein cyc_05341 [Cyclospora cayetanensis]
MENEHEQTFSPGEQNPEEIMYKELSGCWETAIWTDNQLQVEDNSNSAAKLESIWEPVASMRRVAACLDKSAAKGSSSLIEDTNAALSVQSSADASEYEVEPGLARPGEMEMAHSLGVAGTTGSEIEFIAPDSQDCRPPSACSKYSEGSPYHLGSDDGYIVESQSIQQQRSLMEQQHHIHQREENHKKHQVQQQDHMQQQYEQNQYKQEQQNREEEEGQDQERLQQLQSKRLQLGQCGSSSAAPRHVMQPSENVRNLWGLDKPHAEAPYEETTPKEAAKASGSKTSDAQLHTETLQLSPPPDSAIRFPSTGLNEVTTTWGALQLPGGALGEEGEFLTPMEAAQRAAEFAFAAEMAANRAAQLEEGEQPAPRTEAPKSQRLSPAVRLLPETFSGASRSVQPFGSCHQALKSSGGVTYGVSTAPTAPTLCPVALALPSDISDPEEGEVDRDSALAAARYFSTCAIQAAGVAVAGCMQSLQGGPALLRQTMLDERIRHWLPQSCLQGVTIPQDLEGLKSTHASRLGGVGGVSVLKVANLCEKCMQETKEATTQLIDPPIQESVPLSRQGAISGRESEQKAQMSGTQALFLRQQEESQQKVAEEYRQQKCRLEEMEKEMSEKQAQADTDGSQPVFGFLVSLEVKDDVTMQEVRELEQQLVILCLAHLNERKRHLVILRKPLETEGELLRRAAAGQESAVPSRALNGEAATVTSAAPSAASLVANAISQEGQRRIIGVKLKAWNAAARCVRLALAVLTKRAAFLAAHGSTRMLQAVTVGSGLPGGSTLSSQPLRDATAAEASQSVLNGGRDLTSLGVGVSTQTLQCTFAQGLSPRPGVLATATEEASHGAWDGIGTEITPEGHVGAALLTQQHQQPSRHPIDWKPLVGTFLPEEGVSASTAPEGLPERLRSSPSEIFRRLPSGVHWGDLSVLGISRRTHTMTTTEGILGGLRSENSTSYTVNPRATVSPHTTTGAPLDATTPNVAGLPTSKATPASSSMWRPPLSLSPLSWRGGGVIPRDLGHTGLQPPQRRQLAPLPTSSGISYRR